MEKEKQSIDDIEKKVDIYFDLGQKIVAILLIVGMIFYYLYVRPFPFWLMSIPALMLKLDISKLKLF